MKYTVIFPIIILISLTIIAYPRNELAPDMKTCLKYSNWHVISEDYKMNYYREYFYYTLKQRQGNVPVLTVCKIYSNNNIKCVIEWYYGSVFVDIFKEGVITFNKDKTCSVYYFNGQFLATRNAR